MIPIKTPAELDCMRTACRLSARILAEVVAQQRSQPSGQIEAHQPRLPGHPRLGDRIAGPGEVVFDAADERRDRRRAQTGQRRRERSEDLPSCGVGERPHRGSEEGHEFELGLLEHRNGRIGDLHTHEPIGGDDLVDR